MKRKTNDMEFKEALKILGIEEYAERIFNSNSNGELLHIHQYYALAETLGETDWFADWFKAVVDFAEKEWKRPESVFQHILKMLKEQMKNAT